MQYLNKQYGVSIFSTEFLLSKVRYNTRYFGNKDIEKGAHHLCVKSKLEEKDLSGIYVFGHKSQLVNTRAIMSVPGLYE